MTTKVTVDAHAGWPVLVTLKWGEPGTAKIVATERIEPNTAREFFIHSGCQIVGIEEQPRDAVAAPAATFEDAWLNLGRD